MSLRIVKQLAVSCIEIGTTLSDACFLLYVLTGGGVVVVEVEVVGVVVSQASVSSLLNTCRRKLLKSVLMK